MRARLVVLTVALAFVLLPGLASPLPLPETARAQSGLDDISIPSEVLVRGEPGDYWADIIIGQPDFSEITPNRVVPFKVFNPGGVVVDRSVDPGRAYVWDGGNSRVLGIDLEKCYSSDGPCSADIVLGQPSLYDHSACNGDSGVQNFPYRAPATAATLCGNPDVAESPWETHTFANMAVDPVGNLYVPDWFNNRVLLYELPFETDTVADLAWGQTDFSGMTCNQGGQQPSAQSLCFHSLSNYDRSLAMDGWPAGGVALDKKWNLWVADSGNNRVLRFPWDDEAGRARRKADLVLGQPDFHENEPGSGLQNLFAPADVSFDAFGNLHVADAYNHRVLVFEPPFSSGMTAHTVYGTDFYNPTSLAMDPDHRGVWVNYFASKTVALWNWHGTEIIRRLTELDHPGGVGIDTLGNLLVVQPLGDQDMLRFPPEATYADKRFFFPPGGFNFTSDRSVRSPRGLAAFHDQLVVSDRGRLMYWSGLDELTNGQPSDGVVGQQNWNSGGKPCCGVIKTDAAGRLWVLSEEGRHGFIDIYQLPLTSQSSPIHTIWTDGFAFPVMGTNADLQLGERLFGIAPVNGGEFLWLSDTNNHRVLRIRDPLTNPVVDVILGQLSPHGDNCNRRARISSFDRNQEVYRDATSDMLCFPGSLSLDNDGNLWVSDHSLEISGNWRLLMFSRHLFPRSNSDTLYAPHASKVFLTHGSEGSNPAVKWYEPGTIIDNRHSEPLHAAAFEPAFNSRNRMAVGFNMYAGGRFVAVYNDPLGIL